MFLGCIDTHLLSTDQYSTIENWPFEAPLLTGAPVMEKVSPPVGIRLISNIVTRDQKKKANSLNGDLTGAHIRPVFSESLSFNSDTISFVSRLS